VLRSQYGDIAANQFRKKCEYFNIDVHKQYNEAAEAALLAVQNNAGYQERILQHLPVFELPAACPPDAAERKLATWEQSLGGMHANASKFAKQLLTECCEGWAGMQFKERLEHVAGQLQRSIAIEVESRRLAARAAVRVVVNAAEMAKLQRERLVEQAALRNPPARDVRNVRRETASKLAGAFEMNEVEAQVQVQVAVEPPRPPPVTGVVGNVTGNKRKHDLSAGEFVGGGSAVHETTLQKSKREAQAALQARLDSYGASKQKTKSSSPSSKNSSISGYGNRVSSSLLRVSREEEAAAATSDGDNYGMEDEEESEEEMVPVKQEVKKIISSPIARARPPPTAKSKPVVAKAARTPVKAPVVKLSPVKAAAAQPAKRKQPVSFGDTLAAAKAVAAAELSRRAEEYKPTVRGGNRVTASGHAEQLLPEKKKARR